MGFSCLKEGKNCQTAYSFGLADSQDVELDRNGRVADAILEEVVGIDKEHELWNRTALPLHTLLRYTRECTIDYVFSFFVCLPWWGVSSASAASCSHASHVVHLFVYIIWVVVYATAPTAATTCANIFMQRRRVLSARRWGVCAHWCQIVVDCIYSIVHQTMLLCSYFGEANSWCAFAHRLIAGLLCTGLLLGIMLMTICQFIFTLPWVSCHQLIERSTAAFVTICVSTCSDSSFPTLDKLSLPLKSKQWQHWHCAGASDEHILFSPHWFAGMWEAFSKVMPHLLGTLRVCGMSGNSVGSFADVILLMSEWTDVEDDTTLSGPGSV